MTDSLSNSDNRSLPPVIDGLKPSQRKIYCCFKKKLDKEPCWLAGYVSEESISPEASSRHYC